MATALSALNTLINPNVLLIGLIASALVLRYGLKATPTRNAFVLVSAPMLLELGSIWFPPLKNMALWLTMAFIGLLWLDSLMLSKRNAIRVSRIIETRLSIGQATSVTLTLENLTHLDCSGEIQDDTPCILIPQEGNSTSHSLSFQVPAYASQTLDYSILPSKRGHYNFNAIHLRYRSRLGLLWFNQKASQPQDVQVFPDITRLQTLRPQARRTTQEGNIRTQILGQDGTEFNGLRHYLPGDDIRRLAWKSTAKLDYPVIKTFLPEIEQPILILLDASRLMQNVVEGLEKFDWALNAALVFAYTAIQRGDMVSAKVFSQTVLVNTPFGRKKAHFQRLLNDLANVETEPTEADYELLMACCTKALKRRSLIVVFTDLLDPMASRNLLRGLKQFTKQHELIVATLSDMDLKSEAETMPTTPQDVYRKGVALELLSLRQESIRTLQAARNMSVVESPAHKLDEAVIAHYLKLKRRNRV